MMTTQTEAIVVDRSPELARNPGIPPSLMQGLGGRMLTMLPADVENGVRGDGDRCPFACVFRRNFLGIRSVNLSGEHPSITMVDGSVLPISLQPEMIEWIGRFDRGEHVEPMNLIVYR
jgi:hypothetical protein